MSSVVKKDSKLPLQNAILKRVKIKWDGITNPHYHLEGYFSLQHSMEETRIEMKQSEEHLVSWSVHGNPHKTTGPLACILNLWSSTAQASMAWIFSLWFSSINFIETKIMETYLEISIIDSSKVRFFENNLIEVLALLIAALENIEGLGPHFWEEGGWEGGWVFLS